MKYIIIFLIIYLKFINVVYGNGYSLFPPSRQLICNRNPINNIWEDNVGSGILDSQCKAAYEHVLGKFENLERGAREARLQFIKSDEMKVFIPNYEKGFIELKNSVPEHLCCAYNVNKSSSLGNKKGFTIRYNWPATEFSYDEITNRTVIPYEFCVTKLPPNNVSNYFEFYLSKNYDKEIKKMKWSDLELVDRKDDVQPTKNTNKFCKSLYTYKMNINVPARVNDRSTVLLVRYQLKNQEGECIINCSDIKFKNQITKQLTLQKK